MGIVYHGSKVGNLSKLTPRVSMHGKLYVYATEYKQIALAYLGAFDGLTISQITHIRDGLLTGVSLVERRKNVIKETYENVNGYLYLLDDVDFQKDLTDWSLEVVCDKEVNILECIRIDNVLDELIKTPNLNLYFYPYRPEYIPSDDSDMIDEAMKSYELSNNVQIVKRYLTFYPHLSEKIQAKFLEKYKFSIKDACN